MKKINKDTNLTYEFNENNEFTGQVSVEVIVEDNSKEGWISESNDWYYYKIILKRRKSNEKVKKV